MRIPWFELGITVLLAFSFAAVGEIVLRRRSALAAVSAWNESFLVGAGTCAAALFPLSLLWPSGALRAMLFAVAAALAFRLWRGFSRRSAAPVRSAGTRTPWRDPLAAGMIVVVAIAAMAFAALNFRYNYLWDGFQIWAARASILYHEGGLTRWWFPEETYDQRLLTYPPLVPLYEALVSVVRGSFEFDVLKPVFLVFFASMLISTHSAARAAMSERAALAAVVLLALLPPLSTSYAAGAYADMPQAAVVAGAVAAGMRRSRALPWLIGGLTTVKSEGTVLAALAFGAVLLAWFLENPRLFKTRLASRPWDAVVVTAFFASRLGYVRWLGIQDVVYGPFDAAHFAVALARLRTVGRLCAEALLRPADWGFFWPAFFAAAAVLVFRGEPREKSLALVTAAGIAVAAVPFLFTTWDIPLHIAQAYFRLLAQIAPAAAVAISLAYARAGKPVAAD